MRWQHWFIALGIVCLWGYGLWSIAQPAQAQTPWLLLGIPAQGNISDSAPTQDWQIQIEAGDIRSFMVRRISGDLDATLTIFAPDGSVFKENDDLLPQLIYDAALENVEFQEAGVYTVRVGRFSGTGDYRLWVLPAYIRIWTQDDFAGDLSRWEDSRFAVQQEDRLVIGTDAQFAYFIKHDGLIPLTDFYLQAEFDWLSDTNDTEATTGFMFRIQDDGTRRPPGYYFLIKPNHTWSFLMRQGGDFIELQGDTQAEALNAERITLGVWALNSRFIFYANGQLLGEVTDSSFTSGLWGFHVRGAAQSARVGVDDLLLTVPGGNIPRFPDSLATWQSNQPNETIAELQNLNILPDTGSRAYIFTQQTYTVGAVQTRVYLQTSVDETFQNFLLGLDIYPVSGQNVACGVALRYQDAANQTIAYIDVDGGVGLVHSVNGIFQHNTYDQMPKRTEEIIGSRQRLHIFLWDDVLAYYINGQLFTIAQVEPMVGSLGGALINYATDSASCGYENLWVWR